MGISRRSLRQVEKSPAEQGPPAGEPRPLYLAREGRWGGVFTLDDGVRLETSLTGEVIIEAHPEGNVLVLHRIERLALCTTLLRRSVDNCLLSVPRSRSTGSRGQVARLGLSLSLSTIRC